MSSNLLTKKQEDRLYWLKLKHGAYCLSEPEKKEFNRLLELNDDWDKIG